MNLADEAMGTTITLLNKLKATDSSTHLDVWYKTEIPNCSWYEEVSKTVDTEGVHMAKTVKVMLPFSDKFRAYDIWKYPNKQTGYFTISEGDYVINGTITETPTPSTIVSIAKSYNAISVKYSRVLQKRIPFQSVNIIIEGV